MKFKSISILSGLLIQTVITSGIIDSRSIAAEEEPSFYIKTAGKTHTFKRSSLLKSPDLKTVHIQKDYAYDNKPMNYAAIPIVKLFENIEITQDSSIQMNCMDGFSAHIPSKLLLNTSEQAAKAYLAIDNPASPWSELMSKKMKSPGPFYLIWTQPELSKIGREEWPFQLLGFEVKDTSLSSLFPEMLPEQKLPKEHSIQRGFQLYVKNCFSCHSMNGAGAPKMGPDLNVPMNPTEYFKPDGLKTFIRDPRKLRSWPGTKMIGFDKNLISDQELEDILSYLKHMAQRKKALHERLQ